MKKSEFKYNTITMLDEVSVGDTYTKLLLLPPIAYCRTIYRSKHNFKFRHLKAHSDLLPK
jgi:hypothetical protein